MKMALNYFTVFSLIIRLCVKAKGHVFIHVTLVLFVVYFINSDSQLYRLLPNELLEFLITSHFIFMENKI